MADTYLSWWTSIEVDLRKSLVINAMRDHSAMHSLIRNAFDAGLSSATPPSPSTEPELGDLLTYPSPHGTLVRLADVKCRIASASRAALASRPAEVDEEGQADAKRLDWLESTNQTFCGNYSNTGFRAIGSSIWHGTLREAIDGAMIESAPSHTTNKENG